MFRLLSWGGLYKTSTEEEKYFFPVNSVLILLGIIITITNICWKFLFVFSMTAVNNMCLQGSDLGLLF